MSRSLKLRLDYIKKAKLALKQNGFHSQRALAEDSGLALSTVSNFLNGKPVDYATFVEICHKLSLNWQTIADLNKSFESQAITIRPEKENTNLYRDWGEVILILNAIIKSY